MRRVLRGRAARAVLRNGRVLAMRVPYYIAHALAAANAVTYIYVCALIGS